MVSPSHAAPLSPLLYFSPGPVSTEGGSAGGSMASRHASYDLDSSTPYLITSSKVLNRRYPRQLTNISIQIASLEHHNLAMANFCLFCPAEWPATLPNS